MSFFDTPFKKYSLKDEDKFLKTCSVRLILTNVCNMECWYCVFHSKYLDRKPLYFTDDLWKKLIEYIDAQEKEKINFMFTGGEPTTHPKFIEYVKYLHVHHGDRIKIQINTNLKNNVEKLIEFPSNFNLEILATYHSDYSNDLDFLNKVKELEKNHSVCVHLMLEKNNIPHIKEVYLRYKNFNFKNKMTNIDVVPIHEFENDELFINIDWFDKSRRHFAYLKDTKDTSDIVPRTENCLEHRNFHGMLCSGEHIVEPQGDVYHCYQDIAPKRVKTNLLKDKIIKQADVKICQNKHCYDGFFFPKYSIDTYQEMKKGEKDESGKV